MLTKRFYDVLAFVFVVLLIGLTWYSGVLIDGAVRDSVAAVEAGSNIEELAKVDSQYQVIGYFNMGAKVLAGIYWIFMVVLVIGLHKVKKTSMLDIILVVVLSPLAIVFYFLTLRPRLKEVESSSIQP